MSHGMRLLYVLAVATALLVPVTVAQKPPVPPPPTPPSIPLSNPTTLGNSQPIQPKDDLVMFVQGRLTTQDGTAVPNDLLVERVCNNKVRQQVYASPGGDFSMQLGSRADSVVDARGDPTSSNRLPSRDSDMGVSRQELMKCELQVSAAGFRSIVVNLLDLDAFSRNVDVGVIVLRRNAKVDGTTVSAIPYKAPKNARIAYEKGLQAERNGKLADARKYFETAVAIYPSSTSAWFQLGTVLQKQNENDAARKAYTQATTIDGKFLPPFLSLASMAYETRNWADVVGLTRHIMDLDPMNDAAITKYILDLDPLTYVDAYFYNAVANYNLNKVEEAEKSARKAEHLDLLTRFPQVHLLLAEIFTRKNKYAMAISEMQTFLELAPHAKHADQVRAQLAKLETLGGSAPSSE